MYEKKQPAGDVSPLPLMEWLNDTEIAPDVKERARTVVRMFGAVDCLKALGLAD